LFGKNQSTLSAAAYSLDLEIMTTMKVNLLSISEIPDPFPRILIPIQAGNIEYPFYIILGKNESALVFKGDMLNSKLEFESISYCQVVSPLFLIGTSS
jgi:hypothetical protein